MPWASKAQARWGHSVGVKALGGPKKVAEWDAATMPGSLPEKAEPKTGSRVEPKSRALLGRRRLNGRKG